jgi:hypothetical protein
VAAIHVTWSRCAGADCLRVRGRAAGEDLCVRTHTAGGVARPAGLLPPTAGRWQRDGGDDCFVPRFPFVEGTAYEVAAGGVTVAVLERPRAPRPATTSVRAIHPTAPVVPRNLLRLYVHFTAAMADGGAAAHVRLVDDAGAELAHVLLASEHELWDAGRTRLTVLLDPARIKRGLVPHRERGYPLRTGEAFRVVVDAAFRDATGAPLRAGAERRYAVGDDERRHVDPQAWSLAAPPAGTTEALVVTFDRPLDHALAARCLRVVDAGGRPIAGAVTVGPEERSWALVPRSPWPPAAYGLVVDDALEDLAGNSVRRVFDRDLARAADAPRAEGAVTRPFTVR